MLYSTGTPIEPLIWTSSGWTGNQPI